MWVLVTLNNMSITTYDIYKKYSHMESENENRNIMRILKFCRFVLNRFVQFQTQMCSMWFFTWDLVLGL